MVERVPEPSSSFVDLVRDALLHMYDPVYLQDHALIGRIPSVPGYRSAPRGKLLLQALLEAIRSLKPVAGTPSDSRAWRTYHLLELRYVEGQSVDDVMRDLNLGKTQYHRDHARALDAVASLLQDRWQPVPLAAHPDPDQARSRESLALTEADSLAARMSPEYVDIAGVLRGLVTLLQGSSEARHAAIAFRTQHNVPPISADRVALRQILLGLLNAALEQGGDRTIDASVALVHGDVVVTIAASPGRSEVDPGRAGQRRPELEVAQRLAEAMEGRIDVSEREDTGLWKARLTLPIAHRPILLVLDNNLDFIHLVSRYLVEEHWQVIGAQDVRQAQNLALEFLPTVILLDVMMPGQDGWDLLLGLKSRPETKEIPVIVCSVLYEPQIARALGAVDYLPKPVSQAALVSALARWRQGGREPAPSC